MNGQFYKNTGYQEPLNLATAPIGNVDNEQSYIENILRQMPFLSLMPMGNIKLSEVVTYIKTGAAAVGVGRDFYLGFTPKEITARTKEIIKEVKDFSEWIQK